jgi:hypothetical protein
MQSYIVTGSLISLDAWASTSEPEIANKAKLNPNTNMDLFMGRLLLVWKFS